MSFSASPIFSSQSTFCLSRDSILSSPFIPITTNSRNSSTPIIPSPLSLYSFAVRPIPKKLGQSSSLTSNIQKELEENLKIYQKHLDLMKIILADKRTDKDSDFFNILFHREQKILLNLYKNIISIKNKQLLIEKE